MAECLYPGMLLGNEKGAAVDIYDDGVGLEGIRQTGKKANLKKSPGVCSYFYTILKMTDS